MANSKNKRPINCNRELVEKFDYLYPNIKEIFVNRALTLALQDKKYFEDVFFNKLFIEVK